MIDVVPSISFDQRLDCLRNQVPIQNHLSQTPSSTVTFSTQLDHYSSYSNYDCYYDDLPRQPQSSSVNYIDFQSTLLPPLLSPTTTDSSSSSPLLPTLQQEHVQPKTEIVGNATITKDTRQNYFQMTHQPQPQPDLTRSSSIVPLTTSSFIEPAGTCFGITPSPNASPVSPQSSYFPTTVLTSAPNNAVLSNTQTSPISIESSRYVTTTAPAYHQQSGLFQQRPVSQNRLMNLADIPVPSASSQQMLTINDLAPAANFNPSFLNQRPSYSTSKPDTFSMPSVHGYIQQPDSDSMFLRQIPTFRMQSAAISSTISSAFDATNTVMHPHLNSTWNKTALTISRATPTPVNSTASFATMTSRPMFSYSGPPKSYHSRLPLYDRPFKCDQCPQSFNRNHDLKRHKRIHLAVKPYPCTHCEKQFSRKDALKRHILVKGCNNAAAAKNLPHADGLADENKTRSAQ
ncbi:1040_t:CDS:2 [Paraglomus occultum]|uniref:1040_t:CDS:1 n=1 Tax=Paraglomus occultum TaxID=144539 RepID=A0A9N9GEF5_9GLOM|nr:1040_t:CDS:2 [Paraglomus occultum]